ncbi:hypothetical protein FXW07_02310 [Methanosarcina sp. DH1]|uniref:hypothetical protein n=1 Tax=Methanosarcina sp. DH1 TaxID=2605695 RepID=UPI001E608CE1|nr:hypothetical protein [Methanosarcina sp. DH1]MCC4765495.1 hypothetical protein [Methanosarcina sp. DH1]
MTRTKIELYIEELVLEGFPPGDRLRIASAIEAELVRKLESGNLNGSLLKTKEIRWLNLETINMAEGSTADKIGKQIANAIYDGLGR